MSDNIARPHAQSIDPYEDELRVEDWLRLVRGQRGLIGSAAGAGVLVAALVSYVFPPDYVATAQLIIAARPGVELSSALVATYRAGLESPEVVQQVVDELGKESAPSPTAAARLRTRTTVTGADATGILTIAVRSADPTTASNAASSVVRHGMESARKIAERSRIERDLGFIMRLRQELPDLLSQIQREEAAQQIIQKQLKDADLRSEPVQRELVLSRIRLAQLRARWDHIGKGIEQSERLAETLDRISSDMELPASIKAEHESLARAFGLTVGVTAEFASPLRLLSKPEVSEPPGLRRLVTNLGLGFVLGLLLAVAVSLVHYVVFVGPKPSIPRQIE